MLKVINMSLLILVCFLVGVSYAGECIIGPTIVNESTQVKVHGLQGSGAILRNNGNLAISYESMDDSLGQSKKSVKVRELSGFDWSPSYVISHEEGGTQKDHAFLVENNGTLLAGYFNCTNDYFHISDQYGNSIDSIARSSGGPMKARNGYATRLGTSTDENDTSLFVWSDGDTGEHTLKYGKYSNDTFGSIAFIDSTTEGTGPRLATDSNGDVHMAYIADGDGEGPVAYRKYIASGDSGWQEPISLPCSLNCHYPHIACYDDSIYIGWSERVDSNTSPNFQVKFFAIEDGDSALEVIESTYYSKLNTFLGFDVNSDGKLMAAWSVFNGEDEYLRYRIRDTTGTWGTTVNIDTLDVLCNATVVADEDDIFHIMCTSEEDGDRDTYHWKINYNCSFDLKDSSWVTSVRSQCAGTCWSHATLASMESDLLISGIWEEIEGDSEPDLGEYHLAIWAGFDSLDFNDGGDYLVASAYLSRVGAVRDSDLVDMFESGGCPNYPNNCDSVNTEFHHYYPKTIEWYNLDSTLSNINDIKYAIQNYGAISTCIYADGSGTFFDTDDSVHYQPPSDTLNPSHAVAIIGWDDCLEVSDTSNGAWLCKNSLDSGLSNHPGYFWISYYDKHCCKHPEMGAVSFRDVELMQYTEVFYHDEHGWRNTMDSCSEAFSAFTTATSKNYDSTGAIIQAVSFYTSVDDVGYTVAICTTFNDTVLSDTVVSQSGTIERTGFHSIVLDSEVEIDFGQSFYVYLELDDGGQAYDCTSRVDVLLGSKGLGKFVNSTANQGESYYYDGGWKDLYDFNATANFCIKALGISSYEGSVYGEVTDYCNSASIESVFVSIRDIVTDSVYGDDYTDSDGIYSISDISTGSMKIQFEYDDFAIYDSIYCFHCDTSKTTDTINVIMYELLEYVLGDANMFNEEWLPWVIGSDRMYVLYYFLGRPTSVPCSICGFWASADVNGDCLINGSDVIRYGAYFQGQASLEYCPTHPPLWPTRNDAPEEAPDGWPNCE